MTPHVTRDPLAVNLVRWVARLWGFALLLLWGAFFVEHLQWFFDPGGFPPAAVVVTQALHLAMLAGLLIGWRWELAGGIIVLLSAVAFFSRTAGPNFALFAVITAAPAVLWIYCGWISLRRSAIHDT